MTRRWVIPAVAAGAMVVSLGSCGDSTGPDRGPGLSVISGGGVDTAFATMSQPLEVEVRDSTGQPRAGITVRFTSASSVPNWYARPLAVHSEQWQPIDTTDAAGRAAVRIHLGHVAGAGSIIVEARSLGYADTVHYEARPGAPARVAAIPKDSAVYSGGGYVVSGRVFDQYENPRPETPAIVAISPGLTLTGARVNATTSIGREFAVVAYQSLVDTAWMSVVPRGTILTRNRRFGRNGTFAVFNLDGSGFRELVAQQPPEQFGAWGDMGPAWTADGSEFVFHDGSVGKRLFRSDLNGVVRPFLASSTVGQYELWPTLTRDGAWAYFSRGQSSGSVVPTRARTDGSNAQPLPTDQTAGGWHVSPSPDGSQLAYETFGCGEFAIRILDIASGTTRALTCGRSPRWSPTSDLIAYVTQAELRVIRADGTGDRLLSPRSNYYEVRLDWSPDGAWIIAYASWGYALHLVHVESGLVLPLAFTRDLEQPAWRP